MISHIKKHQVILFFWFATAGTLSLIVTFAIRNGTVPPAPDYGFGVYDFVGSVDTYSTGFFADTLSGWMRWDTGHFLKIAIAGYSGSDGTTAFGPVYPLLIRLIARSFLGNRYLLTALLISNVFALLALYLFSRLAFEVTASQETAIGASLVFLGFPSSFFLFAAYPESLFLFLALSTWFAAKKNRWILAGLTGAVATLVRFQGVTLSVLLGIMWLSRNRRGNSPVSENKEGLQFLSSNHITSLFRSLNIHILWCALPIISYGGFHFWMYREYSSVSLVTYERIWGNPILSPWSALRALIIRLSNGNLLFMDWLNLLIFGLMVLLLTIGTRRLSAEFFSYSLVTLLITAWLSLGRLENYPVNGEVLASFSRYALSLFPLFLLLAKGLRKRWTLVAWSVPSISLQAFLLLAFVHWVFVA